jgi:DNA invertase Pin-like site-specific DNA recombinase
MSKITAEHLARGAYVYIRQSTPDQLVHNHESRRRQYALADRARRLGWSNVEIVDDDLGRSGGGTARPGFERLIAAICSGDVGAVFAIEASRLARNGREWHTLIEFCGLVGAVIVDEDGIYDPRHPNDRLLLGMKGTMSELELSMFRQRSQEALRQKARRGELFLRVAAGYVKAGDALASKTTAAQRQLELALQQARYETAHARRQYDAVDPANRLVAGELERRWIEALEKVTKLEREIAAHEAEKPKPLGGAERAQLRSLGADLQRAWSHPAATAATRKRIMRACLNEIIVRKEGAIIDMVLHWHGGDHTGLKLQLKLNAAGRHHYPIPRI